MNKTNATYLKRISFYSISLLSLLIPVAQANDFPLTPPHKVQNLNQPAISIIIDDMGYRLSSGQRAIKLPGAITYSFLPHAPHVQQLSKTAREQNKEVMLHLPMESEAGKKLGPGGLTECMSEKKFSEVLQSSISSVPYVSGFNNHMGSRLTRSPLWMKKLMQQVALKNSLYFVDSKTTSDSVAMKVARSEGLNSIQRDIFIDHEESKTFIQKQLRKLIRKAKKNGTALAIAHPKKITLSELEQWLPLLESQGVKLVPVSELITLQQQRKIALWKKTK